MVIIIVFVKFKFGGLNAQCHGCTCIMSNLMSFIFKKKSANSQTKKLNKFFCYTLCIQ